MARAEVSTKEDVQDLSSSKAAFLEITEVSHGIASEQTFAPRYPIPYYIPYSLKCNVPWDGKGQIQDWEYYFHRHFINCANTGKGEDDNIPSLVFSVIFFIPKHLVCVISF